MQTELAAPWSSIHLPKEDLGVVGVQASEIPVELSSQHRIVKTPARSCWVDQRSSLAPPVQRRCGVAGVKDLTATLR